MTYINDYAQVTSCFPSESVVHSSSARLARELRTMVKTLALSTALVALLPTVLSHAATEPLAPIGGNMAITNGETPVISVTTNFARGLSAAINNIAAPYLVVTTNKDDAGNAANCTEQAEPGVGTDASCSLRDALLFAAAAGSGDISFSSTVFSAGNTAAENTINLAAPPNVIVPVPFIIPANTTITGPTIGSGASRTNLVTIAGVIGGVNTNGSVTFEVKSGVTAASIIGLNLTGGQIAISNAGSIAIHRCLITHNTSYVGGGGIYNSGTMTVHHSTISDNTAGTLPQTNGGSSGGGIFNTGTLTIRASTISGNAASGTTVYGGGIDNSGTLTVINSTIADNTSESGQGGGAPFAGGGGGIYNASAGTVTLINTTITGNSVTGITSNSSGVGGGGILGTAILANSIVAGNTANLGNADYEGTYTDNGGNLVGVSGIDLAPLAFYGGPTQTAIPLPGSPAICYGTAANVTAAQLTYDQRELPRTTYYSGVPVTCVDSGAVQTNYALSFKTQPPATATVDKAITPAPVVELTESGARASYATNVVAMIDSARVLEVPNVATLSNGSAKFTDLVMTAATTNDTFTAVMALASTPDLPTLNAVANSSVQVTVPVKPAVMISPTPGSKLTGGTVTFTWSPSDVAGTQYGLIVGTLGQGSSNIYASPALTGTSVTVSVPTTGATLYVGLTQGTTGPWAYTPYTYTEAKIIPAVLVSPTPGSTLNSGTITFKWTKSTIPGTRYGLLIGTEGQGSSNIYVSPALTGTSVTVNVPTTGATLYVGLTQGTTGPWAYTPYTYTEATITPAVLISPAPGSTLTSGTVTFSWTKSSMPGTRYGLLIGTRTQGSSNIYVSRALNKTSVTVKVPTTGATLYVGLTQGTTGPWMYTPYTYTEATITSAKKP
jgi:hypothetical protein